VEEGTLTLKYEGKPSTDYKPGDSVIVEAGKVHDGINKGNAPVNAIATFVIPKGATLTTQVK
jgi:quercetin dioxygenase-like cupin family protein